MKNKFDFEKGRDFIKEILLQQPKSKLSLDGKYIYMRCIFCGDSRSDKNATSLNIKVGDEENPKFLYNCFRSGCGAKGIINQEFMRMLDINSYEANIYLNKINKTAGKSKRFKRKGKRSVENFPSPSDRLSKAKLKYINERLGLSLSFEDLFKLKIHTAFRELYSYNELSFPIKKQSYYEKLSAYGIAFISTYNDYLIVRNVTKDQTIRRYSIVDIFEDDTHEEKFKFYTIPTKIDILSKEPIVINMTEGAFDILSVYFNLDVDRDYKNHIFISVSGSSYEKALIHFIRQYGLVDIIVNIFSDRDVSIDYYRKVNKKVRKYTNSLEMKVYYNNYKDEKDFGVSKDKIILEENYIL